MFRKIKKLSKLEKLVNGLILGTALHLASGCGILHQAPLRDNGNAAIQDKRLSKANRLLTNFPTPEKINLKLGQNVVRSIDRYLIPDARYLLVHVRQEHYVKKLSEEKKRRVLRVQNDIYLLLDYLRNASNIRLRKVYSEGSVHSAKGEIRFYRSLDYIYEVAIKELNERLNLEESKEKIQKLRLKIKFFEQVRKELILQGADIKLGAERKLRILPAEKDKMPKEIDLSKREAFYAITDKRENDFLEIVSKQRYPLVVVVYGGAHAWGGKSSCGTTYDLSRRLSLEDNIAKHNRKHPNRAFSLVEITVDSYPKINKDDVKFIMGNIN